MNVAGPSARHDATSTCDSCSEGDGDRCVSSKRTCGHHCNHAWSHDACCWCGNTFDDAPSSADVDASSSELAG